MLFITAVTVSVLVGCSNDDDFTPPNYVTFAEDAMGFAVDQNSTGTFDVKVFTSTVTGSDRTFGINVLESSTADAASYSVPATVTIPANTNEGTITVDVTDTNISNSGETLVLAIEGESGLFVGEPLSVSLTRNCPSDLAGTYSVVSSGTSTDGAPVNNPLVDFPYEVTVTKTGENTYAVSDIFAGVYIDWYCDAYGACAETEEEFQDVCGNLVGSFEEPFGTTATITGTNNYDGTFTLTWVNGFGDTATSVYTLKAE